MYMYFYILIIVSIILYLCKNINKSKLNREKLTAYECGFQEFEEVRKKYYLKFYLLSIIFLIFDLETILLYPASIFITYLTSLSFNVYYYFIFILSIGLAFEINKSIIL